MRKFRLSTKVNTARQTELNKVFLRKVATTTTNKDDKNDPGQNLLVLWFRRHFSVVNAYDSKARFFVMYNLM